MAQLIRWDPFREMDRMMQQMTTNDWPMGVNRSLGSPMVDMYEEDGKLIVESHVGGLQESDVEVQVDRGALIISGQHTEEEKGDKKRNYVHRESSTSIYRRILLPKDADAEHIEANLKDGILKVVVPMLQKPEPKKISIKKSK